MGSNPNEEALAENESVLVDYVEATMSPKHDRLIVRKWTGIDETIIDELVKDLRLRTSMKNAQDVEQNYVIDPQTGDKSETDGGRTFEGRWRGVSVRGENRSGVGVVTQTLAFGLVTAGQDLPDSELVGTEDSLFSPHGLIGNSERETKEIRYRGIDPSYIETLKDTITLAASNYIEVKSVRMVDGSYNIHVLIETATFANTTPAYTVVRVEGEGAGRKKTTYRAPEVPVTLAAGFVVALAATSDVIDAWTEQGRDGEAIVYYTMADNTSVEEETGRLVEQCGQIPQVTKTWYDVAAGDVDTVYTAAQLYKGETGDVGYVTKEVFKDVSNDGVATIKAVVWKVQRRGQYVETERKEKTKGQVAQVTKTWYDVPFDDILEIYTIAKAYKGESGDTNFIHKEAIKAIAEDGCAIIKAIAFRPTRVGYNEETHRTSATDGYVASVTKTWYDVPPTDVIDNMFSTSPESVYNEAKEYTGESGDIDFINKECNRVYDEDGYATIWATAWYLPRVGTSEEMHQDFGGIGMRPSITKTWYGVHPLDVASIYATARDYVPSTGAWAGTPFCTWGQYTTTPDFTLKSLHKEIQPNGYATITAVSHWVPNDYAFEEKTEMIEYQLLASPSSSTDSADDKWRYARITYNLKVLVLLDDALDYIDGGLNGSRWNPYNNYQFLAKKVTEISYSDNIQTERINTGYYPPKDFD